MSKEIPVLVIILIMIGILAWTSSPTCFEKSEFPGYATSTVSVPSYDYLDTREILEGIERENKKCIKAEGEMIVQTCVRKSAIIEIHD